MVTNIEPLATKPLKPKTIEECWALIDELLGIIQALQERLNTNSRNSSKPPSTDRKKKKLAKNRSSQGRKAGGQPGHVGVSRKLVPVEQVERVITCPPPDTCDECQAPVLPAQGLIRHQVYEIPVPRYEITEYQLLKGYCSICCKTYTGSTPSEIGKRGFGVRTHALLGLLTSKFKLSKRQALLLLKDFYNMPICVGSVSNIEQRVSQAIEPSHNEIKSKIDKSRVAHIDETGFKQNNRSGWAWLMANTDFSFLHLSVSRGKKVAKHLIGDFMGRTIISDRYPVYDYLPETSRQVCWAHLKRDFQKISERSGIAGFVGRKLLKDYGKIYGFWKAKLAKQFVDNRKTRKKCRHLQNRLRKDLLCGAACSHLTTARTCQKILDQGESLWLFLNNPAIPATNNLAERQLRPLVIAKKLSFGVKSERGARFIERIYSVVLSCQQQNKDVLAWLQQSITSHFTGSSPPAFA